MEIPTDGSPNVSQGERGISYTMVGCVVLLLLTASLLLFG